MKHIQPVLSFLAVFALLIGPAALSARGQEISIPQGTVIQVRMIDSISSDQDRAGEIFRGSLDHAIRVGNRTVLPRGTDAYVKLAAVSSAGRVKGRSELKLQLEQVVVAGQAYPVSTGIIGFRGKSEGKKTAKSTGIGAAVGGGIGALFGGGKGAAIGAGVGAGTGLAAGAAGKGEQIRVTSESLLQFQLTAPLRIRE